MSRTTNRPDKTFHLSSLRHDGEALRRAAGRPGAPGAVVRGRTVADLLVELAGEYRWVCGHVVRGVTTRPDGERPRPAAGDAPLDWWDRSYALLLEVLERVDADQRAWNPAPQPKRAGYWHRRMAHRTALARWDVQAATGRPEPLDAKLAVDGITELFDSLLPAARGGAANDPAGGVRLIAADTGTEWLVRLRPVGLALIDIASVTPEHHGVRAVASAAAGDLLLALTGRIGIDLLATAGDLRLLQGLRLPD
jgi:hypothetical protein